MIRTERSFGVTGQLTSTQRLNLYNLRQEATYHDLLDVMEMVCIEFESTLINSDPADKETVLANHRMAKVLKEKGYEYQYLFCLGAGHSNGNAQAQFLPHAIEWVWKGYAPKKDK